jgi:hypothetical protein
MDNDLDRTPNVPKDTWAGVVSQLVNTASESWSKLARVCILLAVLAIVGAAWWWLHGMVR